VVLRSGRACQLWKFFPAFYRDVGKRPLWRHLLIRADPRGMFSPGNARWRVARYFVWRRAVRR
jgi:hypothetical protein